MFNRGFVMCKVNIILLFLKYKIITIVSIFIVKISKDIILRQMTTDCRNVKKLLLDRIFLVGILTDWSWVLMSFFVM